MFSTDWTFPKKVNNDDSIGTIEWVDLDNVKLDDSNHATIGNIGDGNVIVANDARLIVGGVIGGDNEASDEEIVRGGGNAPIVLGADNSAWGNTVIGKQVNNEFFGVAFAVGVRDEGGGAVSPISNYIYSYDYRFDIPRDAEIVGVEFEFHGNYDATGGGGSLVADMYYVKVKLYFEYTMVLSDGGESHEYLHIEGFEEPEISQKKSYQYNIYNKGQFKGEWPDVISIPTFLNAVNELPGELIVDLARNLDSKEIEYDDILLSGYGGSELLTDEDGETIMSSVDVFSGVGEDTDFEVNNDVLVKEYYGGFEGLVTSDGEEILTSDLEPLQVPNGYPRGRNYYRGYMSEFGINYDESNLTTQAKILHDSDELNNNIYKSPDTVELDNYPATSQYQEFGALEAKENGIDRVAQSFQAPSTFKLKRVKVKMGGRLGNKITMTVRAGNTFGSGTVLGTAESQIPDDSTVDDDLSFSLPESAELTNGNNFHLIFDSDEKKVGDSDTYPARIYFGASYGNGSARYIKTTGSGGWINTSKDFAFTLYEEGGNTVISESTQEASAILKKVMDYNIADKGVIKYNLSSVENTGNVVSADFNTNTLKEALDYILKLSPHDWFYFIDAGDRILNYKSRPVVADHYFTLGKDIVSLRLSKNIESIVNDVYFSGAGDPALFRRHVEADSIIEWRRGVAKLSDNRVDDNTSADILMEAEADRFSQPIWLGDCIILRNEHPEAVKPGQLVGFRGFGNLIDDLTVQIVSIRTEPDLYTIVLGTLLPSVNKRVEDLKRNLDRLEVVNNPSSPS